MRKTGLLFRISIVFVFSVFFLVSCNVPHIDGPQPGWGDIENLELSIDGYLYQGAKVPTVLAMLFVQGELKANGNDGSQNARVHILQEKGRDIYGIKVSAAGDASRSNGRDGLTFEFDDFYLKYGDDNAEEDYVYVLNGKVSEDSGKTIYINGWPFTISWNNDFPVSSGG